MPTLYDLTASSSELLKSCERVADIARQSEASNVGTNNGIKTTEELIARVVKGDSITFDYDRLISEAKSYE